MPSMTETSPISSLPLYRESMGTSNRDALSADELIATCREGDHAAFDELRRRYSGIVLRTAFKLSGNWSEADDIAQEAFIRMFRGVRSLKSAATMPAWLYRVVRNVFIDRYRYGVACLRYHCRPRWRARKQPCWWPRGLRPRPWP